MRTFDPGRGSFYGVYRACRDAAWRCQLEFGVDRLPVKVTGITKRAGIKVVRNADVDELRDGELAVSICDGGSWTVIYDDRLDVSMVRFVTAHELGHIFLGHDYRMGEMRFAFGGGKLACESEADMFAMRLLSPAFALHELGLREAPEIAAVCGIPMVQACERARRMAVLERRGSFYKDPMERKLLERFWPWLRRMGCKEADKPVFRRV